jgi:uncharacterized protein (TIGR02145 family)
MKTKNKTWIYPLLGLLLMLTVNCNKLKQDTPSDNVVTDVDGNVYHAVDIGSQTWMVENLKTTKYRNGFPIPNLTDTAAWKTTTTAAYCWYGNKIANKAIYGAIYNGYAISSDAGNIAPVGWHIATKAEWETLIEFLGGEDIAGGKLKEAGVAHWTAPNGGATNSSGFTALPGGYQESLGYGTSGLHDYGDWLSITTTGYWGCELNSSDASVRIIASTSTWKNGGGSVRCVKD